MICQGYIQGYIRVPQGRFLKLLSWSSFERGFIVSLFIMADTADPQPISILSYPWQFASTKTRTLIKVVIKAEKRNWRQYPASFLDQPPEVDLHSTDEKLLRISGSKRKELSCWYVFATAEACRAFSAEAYMELLLGKTSSTPCDHLDEDFSS